MRLWVGWRTAFGGDASTRKAGYRYNAVSEGKCDSTWETAGNCVLPLSEAALDKGGTGSKCSLRVTSGSMTGLQATEPEGLLA